MKVVLNSGQVSELPWEQHLRSAMGGTIKGVSETVNVEPKLLQGIRGAREIVLDAIRDCSTYDGMAREMRHTRDTVRAIDPYFYLEEFFCRVVPPAVEKKVYDSVLDLLPSGDPDCDAEKTLDNAGALYTKLKAIQTSDLVLHSLPAVGKDVQGAITIFKAMMDGESLSSTAVRTSSEFHVSVYSRCADFLTAQRKAQGGSVVATTLWGTLAMQEHVGRFKEKVEAASQTISLENLRLFRQFRWLLPPADDVLVQKVIMAERKKRQNILQARMLTDDDSSAAKKGTTPSPGVEDKRRESGKAPASCALASSSSAAVTSAPVKDGSAVCEQGSDDKKRKRPSEFDARMALFFPKGKR